MLPALNLAVKRCLIFAMVVTAWVSPSRSATLERLSLDDMINRSTMIVRGKGHRFLDGLHAVPSFTRTIRFK